MQGKRILILCKDETNKVQYFIAKKLMKENVVGAFFTEPLECVFNECEYNKNTYYRYKKIDGIKFYDVVDMSNEFTERLNDKSVNYEYLEYLEKNFTKYKNLNLQLISSQPLSANYHNRFFMKQPDFYQMNIFIELYYKRMLEVIDDFKPDMVLDITDDGYGKTIMFECCERNNIPFITLEHSRYEGLLYPTYTLGLKIDQYVEELYYYNLNKMNALNDELDYVRSFKNKTNIMAKHYANTVTSNYDAPKRIDVLKKIITILAYVFDNYFKRKNYHLYKKNDLIYFSPWKQIKFFIMLYMNNRKLLNENKYFVEPSDGDKYVYMPLHLIPESTVSVKAPWYIDELNLIAQISKALPAGTWLYVKEHQSMIGERALEFYQKASEYHNVKVVKPNYYLDPKPWIEKAVGVITIAGTTAYESALMGKKAIVFSDVPFGIIEGIDKVTSISDLSNKIKDFGEIENQKSCAAYIKTIKEIGKEVSLPYIINTARRLVENEDEVDEKFDKYIDNIIQLYDDALARR
jgi:hypothetical protein